MKSLFNSVQVEIFTNLIKSNGHSCWSSGQLKGDIRCTYCCLFNNIKSCNDKYNNKQIYNLAKQHMNIFKNIFENWKDC